MLDGQNAFSQSTAAAVSRPGECISSISAAERELKAFVTAVHRLYGKRLAECAAEEWIAVAGAFTPDNPHDWRQVSILTASRLATRYLGFARQTI